MDRLFGGTDATAALSRTHAEIDLQVMWLHRLLAGIDTDTIDSATVAQLHRILYGLYGVLKLHNAQEEESLFSLLPEDDGPGDGRLDHIGGVKHPETIGHPD